LDKEKIGKLPVAIYLEKEFRVKLFSKAYDKSGSLGGIAKDMGYHGRPGINGVARDMWLGKRGIGRNKIETLLKLTGIQLSELMKNVTVKEKSVEVESWMQSYNEYKCIAEQQSKFKKSL
jgi:hypothetical protein